MADFNINHITGKQGQQGTVLAGITTVSSTGAMRFPSGPTEQRGGRGRGVFGGGNPSNNVLNYITIASTGNASDFGDISTARNTAAVSDTTRGVFAGGSPDTDLMDYITISSSGGASDFGDLIDENYRPAGLSDATRGIFGGGFTNNPANWSKIRQMQYVTIATTGNATDFGDTTYASYLCAMTSDAHGGLG